MSTSGGLQGLLFLLLGLLVLSSHVVQAQYECYYCPQFPTGGDSGGDCDNPSEDTTEHDYCDSDCYTMIGRIAKWKKVTRGCKDTDMVKSYDKWGACLYFCSSDLCNNITKCNSAGWFNASPAAAKTDLSIISMSLLLVFLLLTWTIKSDLSIISMSLLLVFLLLTWVIKKKINHLSVPSPRTTHFDDQE